MWQWLRQVANGQHRRASPAAVAVVQHAVVPRKHVRDWGRVGASATRHYRKTVGAAIAEPDVADADRKMPADR
jgi:hypothetical protein